MIICHAVDSANTHQQRQVPNGRLRNRLVSRSYTDMAQDFRSAFLHHVTQHKTSLSALARETGVSVDVLKKLKTRATASTSVESAMLIAAYYGKTVNQFVACEEVSVDQTLENLLSLLTPSERQLLQAQMLGLIAAHDRK